MTARDLPPSLVDLEAMADNAWRALPEAFRRRAGALIVRVEDFAEEDVLQELGLDDPFELTGLYVGAELTHQSVLDTPSTPAMVFLYRRPILDEWVERGDIELTDLVAHVLVHEIGHHFGFSDSEMDRILDSGD